MKRIFVALLLLIASLPLLAGIGRLPRQGSAENPSNRRVVTRYLERGPEEAGSKNIVTDILLNYRGYDTNGEVAVIFTALAAVLGVLLLKKQAGETLLPGKVIPVSPIVFFVVRVLAPFIALFAVFVILHGHVSPGGGFQGGTILGALVIAISVVVGREPVRKVLRPSLQPWLQASSVLAFALVGMAGLAMFGHYLSFPRSADLSGLRSVMLIVLEAGIGLGSATIVALLFLTMEAEE